MKEVLIIMDPESGKPQKLTPSTFADLDVKETKHLENWIKDNPDILGSKLLILTTEYDRFDKSDKRLDILALDKDGKLVVIELKRDAAGSLADLQAIRYAAFCSQMTFEEIVQLRAEYARIDQDQAEQEIQSFVEVQNFSKLDNQPRIILAAGSFDDQELTSCVLWLRTFQVDISCVEITPYRFVDQKRIILVPRVIIPLPEARNYIVGIEKKEAQQGKTTQLQREYQEKNAQILKYFRTLVPEKAPKEAWAQRNMKVPTGHGGVHFEWWQRGKGQDMAINVALHFETGSKERNRKLCEIVNDRREEIESSLGETMTFEPNWGEKWSSVCLRKACEPWTEDIARWAAEKMSRLISATQPVIDDYFANQ